MRNVTLIIFLISSLSYSQNIYNSIPPNIDSTQKYIFYLHGRIIEEQGIRPVSEKYGVYEYEKILKSLAVTGIDVISEPRPKNTDALIYAEKVASQIDTLLKNGVPLKNVTIIGASKGAGISVLISSIIKNSELKFVLMAICNDEMAEYWNENGIQLWGRVLYIYDCADEIAGSCKDYLDNLQSGGLTEYKEVKVELGLGHGLLFLPLKEWVKPALEWSQK